MNILKIACLNMFKDTREVQILVLSLFLLLGVFTRDWTLRPLVVGVAIVSCLGVQWLGQRVQVGLARDQSGDPSSGELSTGVLAYPALSLPFNWRSPLITGLGLSLLLRVDHWAYMVLAATIAIGSKFLLQIHHKHIFNPANLGIIACLILTPGAWISPGQWGEEGWYALLFICAGGLVLQRIGRWDTSIAFLGTYAALETARSLWLGWTWDVTYHRLISGSLLIFAFFMVTDPRSIPDRPTARFIWACCLALLTFILRNQFYLSTAPFWALFFLAPLSPVLDALWPSDRFEWRMEN